MKFQKIFVIISTEFPVKVNKMAKAHMKYSK